jgi:hypothetical protein
LQCGHNFITSLTALKIACVQIGFTQQSYTEIENAAALCGQVVRQLLRAQIALQSVGHLLEKAFD